MSVLMRGMIFTVTRPFIMSGQSGGGGWNRAQLAEIGVSWPPVAGWIDRAIGREISPEAAEKFVALRGNAGKARQRKALNPAEAA